MVWKKKAFQVVNNLSIIYDNVQLFLIRYQTHISRIARQILNHWMTREVLLEMVHKFSRRMFYIHDGWKT